jgi:hypothetical protein
MPLVWWSPSRSHGYVFQNLNSTDVMVTVEVTLIRVPELIAAGCSGHRRGRIDRCFRSLFHRRDGHGRGHNDYVSRFLIAPDVVVARPGRIDRCFSS